MDPDTDGREAEPASLLLVRAVTALVRLCGLLSAILILAILVIVAYAITQRYVFNTPLLWGDELNGYLLVAMIMLGSAEALRRGEAFLKAGADILFIEAPRDEAELRKVADTFKGGTLVANIVEDGKTPYLGAKALEELGFRIALFPVSALLAVTARLQGVYETLVKGEGLPDGEARVTFQRYNELIGLGEMMAEAAQITKEIAKEGD